MVTQTALEEFVQAYIEAALWSSTDDFDVPLDKNYTIADIHEATLETMKEDCRIFIENNGDMFAEEEGRAGHDFFLTRNREGCGFWDGDWEEFGDKLTEAAHKFGEVYLYIGDDGRIQSS